jgi:hypothetical protein
MAQGIHGSRRCRNDHFWAERRPTDRPFLAGSNELDSSRSRSNQSRVVERYTLSADGLKVDYEITVTDPVMLAELRAWNCGAERG